MSKPNVHYGNGVFRRRIRLCADAGRVMVELEDGNHGFRLRLHHDGRVVADVDADTIRHPFGTCPEAVVPLREFVGHRAIVVQSHAMFAEVNPLGAHKGAGLARLAESLGIQQDEVMAIGDQENDLTMLAWAGLGVAMGQASDMVKQSARWIAPSLDEDGAAVAIEKFVLGAAAG